MIDENNCLCHLLTLWKGFEFINHLIKFCNHYRVKTGEEYFSWYEVCFGFLWRYFESKFGVKVFVPKYFYFSKFFSEDLLFFFFFMNILKLEKYFFYWVNISFDEKNILVNFFSEFKFWELNKEIEKLLNISFWIKIYTLIKICKFLSFN